MLSNQMKKKSRLSVITRLCACALFGSYLVSGIVYSASKPVLNQIANPALTATDVDPETGEKRLSFYFQNIDIRVLLQLIAKNSGMNFIISDTVKGAITLSLKDVTWQESLNIILKTHALASRRVGNVIFISTIEEITDNEAKQLKSEETLSNLAPLKTSLIRLRYTIASEIAATLKGAQGSLLTPRGEVAIDNRTNSLIIRDTATSVAEVTKEVKKLDVPARQVSIEARIVNIDATYEEELGIKFGLSNSRSLSGNLSGANQLAQGTAVNQITPLTDRLNFNVPGAALFDGANPGTVGLALAHVGHLMLDLELSALEGEKHAQVIARPRVVTANQQKAMIQTGEEIPYQEATSSGATSVVFKKAVLSLEITPQITPDNKIILKLKATQDTRGTNTAVGASGGVPTTIPAINTQAVESNVLLKNNETIVIGGVFKVDKENTIDRIPFFGSLPWVGYLFRHTRVHDEKHELLIFITPKIVNFNPIAEKQLVMKDDEVKKVKNKMSLDGDY